MISWRVGRGLAPGLSLAVPTKSVDGVTDPQADLPLSSESRQDQSLTQVSHSTHPAQGAQGGLWGVQGQVLVSDPCSCCDSCPNLIAWPNKETCSSCDKVGTREGTEVRAQRRLGVYLDRDW